MKRRDFGMLIIGLVVGVLAGLVALSSDGVRAGLFGTAGLSTTSQPAYYLVETGEARNWITSTYPDEADSLAAAFNNAAPLITTSSFGETFRAVQADINLIVDRAYTALTGQTPAGSIVPAPDPVPDPLLTSLADGDVSTCLGLDENPYNVDGYALYLYVKIPSSQAGLMPETWQRLTEPKEDDLFWQHLACQSLGQAQRSQRR